MQAAARTLYVLALALLVVMTVGFGQVTFYPGPEQPKNVRFAPVPALPEGAKQPPSADAEQQRAQQQQFEQQQEQYQQLRRAHARNALAIVTAVGVLVLIAGLTASAAADVLRVGLMLGGIFSVAWGLIASAGDAGSGTMFAVALLAMIVLGAFSLPASRRVLQRAFRISGADLLGPLQ